MEPFIGSLCVHTQNVRISVLINLQRWFEGREREPFTWDTPKKINVHNESTTLYTHFSLSVFIQFIEMAEKETFANDKVHKLLQQPLMRVPECRGLIAVAPGWMESFSLLFHTGLRWKALRKCGWRLSTSNRARAESKNYNIINQSRPADFNVDEALVCLLSAGECLSYCINLSANHTTECQVKLVQRNKKLGSFIILYKRGLYTRKAYKMKCIKLQWCCFPAISTRRK